MGKTSTHEKKLGWVLSGPSGEYKVRTYEIIFKKMKGKFLINSYEDINLKFSNSDFSILEEKIFGL